MKFAALPVLVGLVVLGGWLAQPLSAFACSCPDCDAVRDSEVIVGGTVLGWDKAGPGTGEFRAVLLKVRVDDVYKGTAPPMVAAKDSASLLVVPPSGGGERFQWAGASGACGSLDEDPTGRYLIIAGFNPPASGPWQIGRLSLLYFGDDPPDGDAAERLRARGLGLPRPPDAGNSATADASNDDYLLLSAIGAGLLLFTLLALLLGPRRE